jgi:cation:H+ antiporter
VQLINVAALVGGFVCLLVGAEWLVRGAASLAARLGLAPIVIGLTVVAFGTSAPELAVSVGAALSGTNDMALGNVVGSNVANILLILGVSAAVSGLSIEQRLLRVDIPVLVGMSVLVYLLSLNEVLSRVEGGALFIGLLVYMGWLLRDARRPETAGVEKEYTELVDSVDGEAKEKPVVVQVLLILVGLAMLVVGAQLLVNSATSIAKSLGVSDLVIGLTVVAVGTSLPELATSVLAAFRGQRDIAVGNVVGSNIFNLLSVLGLSALAAPGGMRVADEAIRLDMPVMLAATVVLIPICWNGFMIKRWEGVLLAAFYFAYVAYLVFEAGESSVPELYRTMLLIVVPIVMLAFGTAGLQGWRRHRKSLRA